MNARSRTPDREVALARRPQWQPRMAAVFCFVFLFGLASVSLLASSFAGSAVSAFAFVLFFALTSGVFIGLFKMTKKWEAEAGPEH